MTLKNKRTNRLMFFAVIILTILLLVWLTLYIFQTSDDAGEVLDQNMMLETTTGVP